MAERPLECSECKKKTSILYTEVVGNSCNSYEMCSDCPYLERHVYGSKAGDLTKGKENTMGVCCGSCGTTLDEVRMGNPLGCEECYAIFSDVLYSEVFADLSNNAVHCGREPGEGLQTNPALKLYALNEALKETLSREAYEEAARIRDEIKALKEDDQGDS